MTGYEIGRVLAEKSYQDWITKGVFSTQWFVIVGVLIVVYSVWFKLVDKKRLKDLVLFGSLIGIGFSISDTIISSYFGFYSHKITLLPIKPPVFVAAVTIVPIMFMLVMQYTSSWRSFILGACIVTAVYSFVLQPAYLHLGIIEYHKGWNYFYNFIRTVIGGVVGRAFFLWLSGIEQRHTMTKQASQQMTTEDLSSTIVSKPAMKSLDYNNNQEK